MPSVQSKRFIANDADRAQPHLGLAPQPTAQLGGLRRRADEQRLFFPAKNSASEKFRQKVMRKEERDIEPGEEVEEENSRNERVLRCDQIKDEHADTGECLAEGEAMLAEEFALEKISFRAFPAERFTEEADDEHRAVNAVATPGKLRALRVKRHHYPDAKPEERRHDPDLAEQKKTIQSLRALGDHGYRLGFTTAKYPAKSSLSRSPEETLVCSI